MKPGKALAKYFAKRALHIDSLLNKSKNQFTPEDFHKLRVEIKKLHALFKVLNFCVSHFEGKVFYKPFKGIFKQAGKVRELQLEEAMLKKHNSTSLKTYLKNLKIKISKERKIYFSTIDMKERNKLKQTGKKFVPSFELIKRRKADKFIRKRRKEIRLLLKQSSLAANQVHRLRKQLKEFHYCSNSLNLRKQDNESLKGTDAFQELMGKWHDCRVISNHLKRALSARLHPAEEFALKKIIAKLSSDSDILLLKVNASKQANRKNLLACFNP